MDSPFLAPLDEAFSAFTPSLHPRDLEGKFRDKPGQAALKGPWKGKAADEVRSTVAGLLGRYDVPLRHVEVGKWVDEIGQYAGKSKDTIHVSPRFLEDEDAAKREREWKGISKAGEFGRAGTIVHEFGHIIDGVLLSEHPKAYAEIDAFLEEKVPGVGGKPTPRLKAGLEAPSAYGSENRYEFVAEAFTDWYFNGAKAHPSSVAIGKIIDRALRHRARTAEGLAEPPFLAPPVERDELAEALEAFGSWDPELHPRDWLGRFRLVRALGGGGGGAYLVKSERSGKEYVAKRGNTPGHVRSEHAAKEIYRAGGVRTPRSRITKEEGIEVAEVVKGTQLNGWVERTPEGWKPKPWAEREWETIKRRVARGFAMDALLAHWDVAGPKFDNILVDNDLQPVRVDAGGAMGYSGFGTPKPKWDRTVGEFESMRKPGRSVSALFGDLDDEDIREQIRKLPVPALEGRIAELVKGGYLEAADAKVIRDRLAFMQEWARVDSGGSFRVAAAMDSPFLAPLEEVSAQAGFRGWDPKLHPRDLEGKFRQKVGGLNVGQTATLPGGGFVKKVAGGFEFSDRSGKRIKTSNFGQAVKGALDRSASSTHPQSVGGRKRYEGIDAAKKAAGGQEQGDLAVPRAFTKKGRAETTQANRERERRKKKVGAKPEPPRTPAPSAYEKTVVKPSKERAARGMRGQGGGRQYATPSQSKFPKGTGEPASIDAAIKKEFPSANVRKTKDGWAIGGFSDPPAVMQQKLRDAGFEVKDVWGQTVVTGRKKTKAKEAAEQEPAFLAPLEETFVPAWDEKKHPRAKSGTPTGGKFVRKGSSGDMARGVQKKLGGLKVDGTFGSKSVRAVKQFQKKNDLKVDGVVGQQTAAMMISGTRRKVGALTDQQKMRLKNWGRRAK
jgi:peptidoglycan hydrolase-like protein with peptidoglycan-binding domain